jgi:hypothetical protein
MSGVAIVGTEMGAPRLAAVHQALEAHAEAVA